MAAPALPPGLVAFCAEHGIDASIYSRELPRYVRLNPRVPCTAEALAGQLGPLRRTCVPGVLRRADTSLPLAASAAYRAGQVGRALHVGRAVVLMRVVRMRTQVYGIDLSSAIACCALDASPGHAVLDLCCAPGAKLTLLADMVDLPPGSGGPGARRGTVTGVDIHADRLQTCRGLLRKYRVDNAHMVLCDGRTFSDGPRRALNLRCNIDYRLPDAMPARLARAVRKRAKKRPRQGQQPQQGEEQEQRTADARAAEGGSAAAGNDEPGEDGGDEQDTEAEPHGAPSTAAEAVSATAETPASAGASATPSALPTELYDRVLVDAECTHDGSILHMQKFEQNWGWDAFETRVLDPQRVAELGSLQRALLANGFRLLRPGGVLVYSTCSFSAQQNEDVVAWLLQREPAAELEPLGVAGCIPAGGDAAAATAATAAAAPMSTTAATTTDASVVHYTPGRLPHTARFDPVVSETSAFFLARIRKRAPPVAQ
jgi:16S rRNA C967 or C1407 C5-methylase (RsmB/RsmF family)